MTPDTVLGGGLFAGVVSYGLAGATYALLAVVLSAGASRNRHSRRLIVATVVTAAWAFALAIHAHSQILPSVTLFSAEVVRFWAWIAFLAGVGLAPAPGGRSLFHIVAWSSPAVVLVIGLVLFATDRLVSEVGAPSSFIFIGPLVLCVVAFVLVEQIYRNTQGITRWAVKFLCLGMTAMLAYDLFLYANGILYKQVNLEFWSARGVIIALTAPMVAISARRNADWSLDIFVSRKAVFYTASLFVVSFYLMIVAIGGYYIRLLDGSWGEFAQVLFIFGAALGLAIVFSSSQVRAEIRVFLAKHFYRNKYEYRDEWLRLISTLDDDESEKDLADRAIKAIVEVVGGASGTLWLKSDRELYEPTSTYDCPVPGRECIVAPDSKLVAYLKDKNWIIDVSEFLQRPAKYPGLELPAWMRDATEDFLLIPIKHSSDLVGFAAVQTPVRNFELTFEDIDLLRTAGRQIGSYLYLESAMNRLAESQQFEAFNRLSGFMMHDLKNIVSQQSLVVQNAARHKKDPKFIDDAIETINNSVTRMRRLLSQIESKSVPATLTCPDLADIVKSAVKHQRGREPVPELEIRDQPLRVLVDEHRCQSVLEHLITNAQDATPNDGFVKVRLLAEDGMAVVQVYDSGSGMDEEFVAKKLFKPFFSTKGAQGMGIGAYQAREFAREAGGVLKVDSRPDEGTCFSIFLPVYRESSGVSSARGSI